MSLEVGNTVRVLATDGPVPRGTIVSVRQVAASGRVRVAGNGITVPTWLGGGDVELVSATTPDVLHADEAEAAPEPEPPEQPEPPKSRFAAGVRRKASRALAEDAPVVAVDARGEVVELPEPDEHAKDHAIRVPESEPTRPERWAGLTERERRWLCRMPPEWEPDTLEQVVMDAMAQGMPAEGAQALVAELVGRIRAIVREEAA